MKYLVLFYCFLLFACTDDSRFEKPVPKDAQIIDVNRFNALLGNVEVLRAWELKTDRANVGYKEFILELKGFKGGIAKLELNTTSSKSTLTKPILARLSNAKNLIISRYSGFFSDASNKLKISYSIDFIEFKLKDDSTSEWVLIRESR